MAYNLKNKTILNELTVNGYQFKINCNGDFCPFYMWSDYDASLSDKKVDVLRINVNLSEIESDNLLINLDDHKCIAVKDDYMIFYSKEKGTYIVVSTVSNSDVGGDFSIQYPSKKSVSCSYIENKISFKIKGCKETTDSACILDIWILTTEEGEILSEIIENICL